MNRSIVSRTAITLMSVGLMVFSLAPNLATNAQDKETCKDLGWTATDASEVNLSGVWSAHQSRNCKPAAWQYDFSVTITKEEHGGGYTGTVSDGTPLDVHFKGSGIVFVRDLRNGAGSDKDKQVLQVWRGRIQQKDGSTRIYGTWSGAFGYLKKEGYNMDFMLNKVE